MQDDLLKQLEQHGWSVTRHHEGLEPWAHEIWTLESRWSRSGLTLFLTFLIDSQPGNANPFWMIGTSRKEPTNRSEAQGEPSLQVTPNSVGELPRFVAEVDALRKAGGKPRPLFIARVLI